jgi:hypothetical protein
VWGFNSKGSGASKPVAAGINAHERHEIENIASQHLHHKVGPNIA